jgi:hypothetical protein
VMLHRPTNTGDRPDLALLERVLYGLRSIWRFHVSGGQSTLAVVVQDGHSQYARRGRQTWFLQNQVSHEGLKELLYLLRVTLVEEGAVTGVQRPGGQKADPRRGHGELPAEFGIAVAEAREHKQPREGLLRVPARGVPETGQWSCCTFVFVDQAAEDIATVELLGGWRSRHGLVL